MKHELIQYVKLGDISEKRLRIRMIVPDVTTLAASLDEVGLLQPIRLRRINGELILVDGERRFLAAAFLKWEEIAAIIENAKSDDATAVQQGLVANLQRKSMSAPETARSIDQLMQLTGCTASEAAKRIGFSHGTVSKLLSLLTLPEAVQQSVETGNVAMTTAYEFTKLGDAEKQAALAAAAANGEMTREAVIAVVQRENNGEPGLANAVATRGVTAKLGDGKTVRVSAPELTLDAFVACLEVALGRARKARRRGFDLLTFLKTLNSETRKPR